MKKFCISLILISVVLGALVPKTGIPKLDNRPKLTEEILSNPRLIWFRAGVFDINDGPQNTISPKLNDNEPSSGFAYYIVQFNQSSTNDLKEQIISGVDEIQPFARAFYYIPNDAWVFRLPVADVNKVRKMDCVSFVHHLPPYFKLHPEIVKGNVFASPDPNGFVRLKVQVFQGDDFLGLGKELSDAFDATIISSTEGAHHDFIIFEIEKHKAVSAAIFVANSEQTEWVERYYPNKINNDWSRWITQSYNTETMGSGDNIWSAQIIVDETVPVYQRGIYGQNQVVGYCDSGLDTNSTFFYDNGVEVPKYTGWSVPEDTGHRKIRSYNRGSEYDGDFDDIDDEMSGHGTHVGGSIAGDNPANDPAYGIYDAGDGMAPLARLVFTDGANGTDGIYTPTDMNTMFNFARDAGAFIHSNSYGNDSPSYYNTNAQECDEFMYYYSDFLVLFAAGNDNNDSPPERVAVYNCAKNIVSVGASETGFGSRGDPWAYDGTGVNADLEDMAVFSTHGPTDEGLLKPNVTVPGGWNIWSADNVDGGAGGHDHIRRMGGTSMACPTCAGITAQIRQYLYEGYYPSGSPNPGDMIHPSGALMKAMLIAGTRNMTGDHTTDVLGDAGHMDAPSNGQGWGRVVLDDCLYFDDDIATDTRKLWIEDTPIGFFDSEDIEEYFFVVEDDAEEAIKIVLVWSDYPGSPAAGTPGVNDLDLIVDMDGVIYRGNNFAEVGSRSITDGSSDRINREEVVWLDPVPGASLIVTVEGALINSGPQPFAVVVVGEFYEGIPNARPEMPNLHAFPFDNARLPISSPTFTWDVPSDGDGDALHFIVEIDDGSDFLFPIVTYRTDEAPGLFGGTFPVAESSDEAISLSLPMPLEDTATIWWRVRAFDGVSNSRWTSPRSLTIDLSDTTTAWMQTTTDQFQTSEDFSASIEEDGVSIIGRVYVLNDDFESYESTTALESEWTGYNSDYYDITTAESVSGSQSVVINDYSGSETTSLHNNFAPLSEGFIETWCKTQFESDQCFILTLYDGGDRKTQVYFREDSIALWDGDIRHRLEPIITGIWRYYCLDFNCADNEIFVTIDESVYGPYTFFGSTPETVSQNFIGTHLSDGFMCQTYFDDFKIGTEGLSEGYIISEPIISDDKDRFESWSSVSYTKEVGSEIEVHVERLIGGSWTTFTSSTTSDEVATFDISELGRDTIRLRADFNLLDEESPALLDWTVSWSLFPESISESPTKPEDKIISVYPNPFNSSLSINAPDDAIVTIHDTKGRLVTTLGLARLWQAGDDVPTGIYLIRVKSDGVEVEMKGILIK